VPKRCFSSETRVRLVRNTPVCRLFALIEALPLKPGIIQREPQAIQR